MTVDNDWELHYIFHDTLIGHLFHTLPYFWLVLLGLFFIGAEYYFRNTKKGYKYSSLHIMLAIIIVNVIGGTVFYYTGFAYTVDTVLAEQIPEYYEPIIGNRHFRWVHPEEGRLSGEIEDVGERSLILQDINGNLWHVTITNTRIATGTQILPEAFIRVIGVTNDDNDFTATYILPIGNGPGVHQFKRMFAEPHGTPLR